MEKLDPKRTALLLMDFQNGILGRLGSDADSLIARVVSARDAADAAGVQVIYVRVAFTRQGMESIPDRNKMFSARAADFEDGTPKTEIVGGLTPRSSDIVVRKSRVGAFTTTNLEIHLRGRGIEHLILAGVSTGGVVLSTVRGAADRDYGLHVLADCCNDADEEVHRVLTEKVFPRQADVIDSTELAGLFS